MLISQVEHARLSYELACDWGAAGVAPLVPRGELLATILHHDDGWLEWERLPGVDPQSGRPLNFLEMPIDEAVVIWQRSIAIAAETGPLSAYLVAGHFATLLSRAREAHESDAHWQGIADSFLNRQAGDRAGWLAAWQSAGDAREVPPRSRALADRGLAQLQLFDALSVWLCLAELAEAVVFPTPQGPELTWIPLASGEIAVDPWPWCRPLVRAAVTGRIVAAGRYGDRGALAKASSETGNLQWTIHPAGS